MNFDWTALLVNWGPMLFILVIWVFIMVRMRGQGGFYSNQKRAADALERIAAALEKRPL